MPRYLFDTHEGDPDKDGRALHDTEGTELPGYEAARKEAMRFLPDLARQEILRDGNVQSLVVLVTDEDGRPVYSGTLSFAGVRLQR